MEFAKAFGFVNHQILLGKLEYYGIGDNAHKLLKFYLSNRLQRTINKENQTSSTLLAITIGVPQGSVLGPFLFLVCLDPILLNGRASEAHTRFKQ